MRDKVRQTLGSLVAQLFFIAAGVYLGNRADDWRQEREHRRAARAALVNFAAEIRRNQAALAGEAPYHAQLARGFQGLARAPETLPRSLGAMFDRAGWKGSGQVAFRHTAWDLALANQSLGYMDQRLAFALADVYLQQQKYEGYQDVMQRAVFTPASFRPEAVGGVTFILMAYYSDAAGSNDPGLARLYDAVLPRLDSAVARLPR